MQSILLEKDLNGQEDVQIRSAGPHSNQSPLTPFRNKVEGDCSFLSTITAVQIGCRALGLVLISLSFWIDCRLFRNQVHRGDAEIAERYVYSDPIPPWAGLDHKTHPFGNGFKLHSMAMGRQEYVFTSDKGFLFGGPSPPNKKMTSLRPQRLSGENVILDRDEIGL